MYQQHFGLYERPFAITPDPGYLFLSAHHEEALAHLLYGVRENGVFVQLTGEVGTGKTTLIRSLLTRQPDDVDIALCLNPKQTVREFVAGVCDELGVAAPPGATLKTLIDALNRRLLDGHARGRQTVMIADEAQLLGDDVLEQVRLLTNLETGRHKLLQIILVGQPELSALLARPALRPLAQRITARYHLPPLDRAETHAYIAHRLQIAGAGPAPLLSRAARAAVFRRSGGIPRLINVICDRALLGAYASGRPRVGRALAERAAREVLGRSAAYRPRAAALATATFAATLGGAVALWPATLTPVDSEPPAGRLAAGPAAGADAPLGAPASATAVALPVAVAAPGAGAERPAGAPAAARFGARAPGVTIAGPTPDAGATAPRAGPYPPRPAFKPGADAGTIAAAVAAPALAAPVVTAPVVGVRDGVSGDARDGDAASLAVDAPLPRISVQHLDLAARLAALDQDDGARALLRSWGESAFKPLPDGDGCARFTAVALRCLDDRADWEQLRRYNRPALIDLAAGAGRKTVLLRALSGDLAVLLLDGSAVPVPLTQLTPRWNGRFVLLWRAPVAPRLIGPGSSGAPLDWLHERLRLTELPSSETAAAPTRFDAALRDRVKRFQRSRRLDDDGLVGSRTMLLLNNVRPAPDAPRLDEQIFGRV